MQNWSNDANSEADKVGYRTYILAKNVCIVEAEQRCRYHEIKAAFLNNKITREVKAYDEKLNANVMSAEIDDTYYELIYTPVEIIADNTAEEKTAVTTKIVKNGTKIWYVNGKRTNREVTLQAAVYQVGSFQARRANRGTANKDDCLSQYKLQSR